jgi:tryptophan synthase alpha chain
MSRIPSTFAALKAQDRKALIPFITAGDPDLATTLSLMHQLVAAGADIIELGVPFSDPLADGPTIQRSYDRALLNKVSLKSVLALVASFRETNPDTPGVLMGYMNPIERMGASTFVAACVEVGVDGVLVVDMPPEECEDLTAELHAEGLDTIFLLTPTTSDGRAQSICAHSSGYVYYVSIKGVTGANTLNVQDVAHHVARLRQATDLPIAVGFGIKSPEDAEAVAQVSDGVIVGSALINLLAESAERSAEQVTLEAASLIKAMREGMDTAKSAV